MNEKTYLLEIIGMSKKIPGGKALDGINFRLEKGSTHTIIGEKGSGESAFIKCIFGLTNEDSGTILLEGKKCKFSNPKHAVEHGVALISPDLNQNVKQNILDCFWLGKLADKKAILEIQANLNDVGLSYNIKTMMVKLSFAERQLVEIARAIYYKAKVLVFESFHASFKEDEADDLYKLINKLKLQGSGIIYVSHKVEDILKISDAISVMRDGQMSSIMTLEDINFNNENMSINYLERLIESYER